MYLHSGTISKEVLAVIINANFALTDDVKHMLCMDIKLPTATHWAVFYEFKAPLLKYVDSHQ